jgi:hypothetical protein
MRLVVYPDDGTYDLSFTATVPDMPVTIRLQLWFFNPKDPKDVECSPTHRITLPPIRLVPAANLNPGDPNGNTFQIAHRGNSSLFRSVNLDGISESWAVKRVGTARFGSAIAVEDANR